jgi:hypothetical protein
MGRISFQTARDVDDMLRRAADREGIRVGPYCREASIYRAAYGIPYYEMRAFESRLAAIELRLGAIERKLGITPDQASS